jgi:hypothetical protein
MFLEELIVFKPVKKFPRFLMHAVVSGKPYIAAVWFVAWLFLRP